MTGPARLLVLVTSVIGLGVLPVVAIVVIFLNVVHGGLVTDFENVFYVAAHAILDGESPYPRPEAAIVGLGKAYVYPPPTALASIPLTPMSSTAAGLVVMALLSVMVVATLRALDVRDWRCYGMVFLWSPVLSAIQTGNITIPLALGAALAWRWRDDARQAGVALGVSLAAKVVAWPVLVWMLASRRVAATAYTLLAAALVVAVSWGVIGFDGIGDYPELLRRLQELERGESYTVYALAVDLGASSVLAGLLWAAVGIAVLASAVVLARRGDDRRAFVLAVAAALTCSPIVWLHYFAFLVVVVAVAEPRLTAAWFVPLAMYGSTGTFNGTTLQTALTLAAAAATVVLALRIVPPLAGVVRLDTTPPLDAQESR